MKVPMIPTTGMASATCFHRWCTGRWRRSSSWNTSSIVAARSSRSVRANSMHDTTALVRPAAPAYTPADNPRFLKLHRRFPTVAYLRQHARRHVPRFAFEYLDGGAGADGGIARNWRALDAVELVPRYGVTTALPPVAVELFGRPYSAPI